jgi:hypothetical protein
VQGRGRRNTEEDQTDTIGSKVARGGTATSYGSSTTGVSPTAMGVQDTEIESESDIEGMGPSSPTGAVHDNEVEGCKPPQAPTTSGFQRGKAASEILTDGVTGPNSSPV